MNLKEPILDFTLNYNDKQTNRQCIGNRNQKLSSKWLLALIVCFLFGLQSVNAQSIPMWGVFETSITNTNNYNNKFRDVELNATFKSPSGKTIPFWGFFDGDGNGGPSRFDADNPPVDNAGELSGTIWKLRFMPNEKGKWTYTWSFSDNSKSGSGSFDCVTSGAKPGIIKPNSSNFHWLQTPDSKPFLPRVWYTMVSELPYTAKDFAPAYYQKAINRGYNLFVTNIFPTWNWTTSGGALPSSTPSDTDWLIWYQNKPYQGEKDNGTVYDTDRMNLFAWKRIEDHVNWLANKGVYIYPFQGFAIKRTVPDYRRPDKFSDSKAKWFLKYCMARMAPYYNMIWNYTWEVDPGTQKTDKFGQWIDQYDPWDHMYTVQSLDSGEGSGDNYSNSVYDMSTIEIGGELYSGNEDSITNYYKFKKPIFMIEDYRPLWRKVGQNDTEALDKAWRLICNGSFFAWSEIDYNNWPSQPWNEVFTHDMADYITTLYKFFGNETDFASLKPRKDLVSNGAFALAQPGSQYVVYKPNGGSFNITLGSGTYEGTWLDPFTNGRKAAGTVSGSGTKSFTTPSNKHYVLFLDKTGDSEATSTDNEESSPTVVSNPSSDVLFRDDFSGSLSNWDLQKGNAFIENGKLILEGNGGHATLELKNSRNFKNVSIEMDITILPFQYGIGSIHFRKDGTPFYHFTIEKYNASAPDFRTRLRVFKNESEPAFASVDQEYPVNQRRRVRIDVQDRTINVYVDGKHTLNYTPTDIKSQGSIAFNIYRAKWVVDNFVVRSLDGAVAPTPIPLKAPSNLSATALSNSSVELKWIDNSSRETGFEIHRRIGSGSWSRIKTIGANRNSFTNTSLSKGTTYHYRIRAKNVDTGELSAYSNEVSVTTLGGSTAQPPQAPSSLIATVLSSSSIELKWKDNSGNESGFQIYRKIGSGSWSRIKTVGSNATSFTNTGLSAATLYSYRVRAQNADGTSAYSNEVSAKTPSTSSSSTPNAPSSLSAAVLSSSSIELRWKDNSSNETGFKIYRKIGSGSWKWIKTVGANVTSFKNTSLSAGTLYSYRMRAENSAGNSAYSNEVSAKTPSTSTSTPPNAPSSLIATALSSSSIELKWKDNSGNESGFQIYRKIGSGSWSRIKTVGSNVTSFTNTGLSAATLYSYRVRAQNADGTSAYSNEVSAKTPSTSSSSTPNAPSSLSATVLSSSSIELRWKDNSSNETGFKIYRKIGSGSWKWIKTVGANVTSFKNTSLSAGTLYSYRMRAENSAGNSAYSNEVSAKTPSTTSSTKPEAPTDLTATVVSSNAIQLQWTDNSSNETGFNVYRKIGSGSWKRITTVIANVTSYKNTALTAGTLYAYRVSAINSEGGSWYTNEVSLTTDNVTSSTVPQAPSNLTATVLSSTTIQLKWRDNSSNETEFKIYRKIGSGSWKWIKTVGANVTGFKNSSLSAGTVYSYRVRAGNSEGSSSYSNEVVAKTTSSTEDSPDGSENDFIITNLKAETINSSKPYQLFDFKNGALMYRDRSFSFTSVPSALAGHKAIRTGNNDKFSKTSNLDFIRFDVNQRVDVYIVYTNKRSRIESDWLNDSKGWVLQNFTAKTTLSGDEAVRLIRKKTFDAGTIKLPGNGATDKLNSMYNVVIKPSASATQTAAVKSARSLQDFVANPESGTSEDEDQVTHSNYAAFTGDTVSSTTYEDAEDADTTRWLQYAGGSITTVSGGADGSAHAIEIIGDIEKDVFRLGNSDGANWDNESEFSIEFSVAFDQPASGAVYVQLDTNLGTKYVVYIDGDIEESSDPDVILVSLGELADGQWHTISRGLEDDLKAANPDAQLKAVEALFVYGSLKLDNVRLLNLDAPITYNSL